MPTQTASLNFQFTAQGQFLATQALAGKIQIDFTKAVSSSTNHFGDTAAQAAQLTDLDNKQQTVTVTEVDAIDGDQSSVKIPVVFNKSNIDTDYQLLTIGLYAKPVDGDEVLYAECALQDPVYMHKTSNSSTYSIDLFVIVGTSANVTLKVDPAGVVSHADLTAALKDYATTAYVDDKISTIPKPDMSKYQTPILTADDGSAKVIIASGDSIDDKLKALISDTKDSGKLQIDIGATGNPAGHSLVGEYFNDFGGMVNGYGIDPDNSMWLFANNGTTTEWKRAASADNAFSSKGGTLTTTDDLNNLVVPGTYQALSGATPKNAPVTGNMHIFVNAPGDPSKNLTKEMVTQIVIGQQDGEMYERHRYSLSDGGSASWNGWVKFTSADDLNTAKQAAIDQSDTDTDAKLAKLPQFWNGTQAEFDAIATKDPNTYYYIYDES